MNARPAIRAKKNYKATDSGVDYLYKRDDLNLFA